MMRRLFFLFLAAVLAWFLAPTLSSFFTGGVTLAGQMPGGFRDYFTKRSGDFYLQFFFWLIVLWFVLPLFFSLFNVFAPQARRYGTTKLLRRIHGVTTELALAAALFVGLTVIFGLFCDTRSDAVYDETIFLLNHPPTESLKTTPPRDAFESAVNEYKSLLKGTMARQKLQLTNWLYSMKAKGVKIEPDFYDLEKDSYSSLLIADLVFIQNTNRKTITSKVNEAAFAADGNYPTIRSNYLEIKTALKSYDAALAEYHPGGKLFDRAWEQGTVIVSHYSIWRKYFLLPLPKVWPCSLLLVIAIWFFIHVFCKANISFIHGILIRFLDEGRFGLGGSGRFAGMFEEWGLLSGHKEPGAMVSLFLTPFGKAHWGQQFGAWMAKMQRTEATTKRTELFMGRSLYNPFLNIGMSGDQHMLTIAPSRSGKGATAIIPNLLLWEGSAIIIDPKGTNAVVTAERRRQMGQKVHLIDPFGIVEKNAEARACFNPLAGLDPDSDTIREDIGVIADALVVPDPEAKEKHWDDGARTILCGLIGQLITGYQNPSLPLLRELLALPQDKQDELWATMYLNPDAANAPRDAASRIIRGAGTNEISGLISNADKHTEWLSSPAMQKTLSRSTFTFAELKEQPTTIYLILPPQFLSLHNRFLRLFINMAILQMAVGGRSKIPVLMVMDEFLALGHMAEVEKALGLMAGYNLILWPIIQDLARLKDLYKNSFNSFIANSRAVQVFGVTDPETTEYISKQLGNSAASVLPTGKFSTFVPLRSPDEVAKDIVTDSERQYILRAGKPPLVLEKVPYYRGGLFDGAYPGLFHGKYTADPDHSK